MNDYAGGKPWKIAKAQHIMEAGFRLFSERGIEPVTMPDVAKASGVGTATVFRYFSTKLELVVAISTYKWEEYIAQYDARLSPQEREGMTGAELLRFYMDAFLDLYRSHSDILRFNYSFNGYLRYEAGTPEQRQPYRRMVDAFSARFHEFHARGLRDGSLRGDISEGVMFSSSFHIMLAAVTRYAVGLVVVYENGEAPENELVMLEELLLSRFTNQ